MLMNVKKQFVVLLFALYAPGLLANSCYDEKSPNYTLGDKYFDYQSIKLKTDEARQLKKFIRNIRGKWSGKAIETFCEGPDTDATMVIKHSNAMITLTTTTRQPLLLNISKEYAEEEITSTDIIELLGSGSIASFKLADNTLLTSDRHRQKKIFVEWITKIKKVDTRIMQVDLGRYVNGVFAYKLSLDLRKKY